MRHHKTLLHNLLQFIPWSRLEALVDEHGSDRRVRKLSSKSQLIVLVHAQLSGACSLREVDRIPVGRVALSRGIEPAIRRSRAQGARAVRPRRPFD